MYDFQNVISRTDWKGVMSDPLKSGDENLLSFLKTEKERDDSSLRHEERERERERAQNTNNN